MGPDPALLPSVEAVSAQFYSKFTLQMLPTCFSFTGFPYNHGPHHSLCTQVETKDPEIRPTTQLPGWRGMASRLSFHL